jgi:hypothetical protein
MATLAEELERRLERVGVKESPRKIEELILAAVDDLLADLRPMDPLQGLTPAEQDALRRGGLVLEKVDLGEQDPILKTAMRYSAMVATGLGVAQAAARLGIDESRVRHRLADRTLYGFKIRGNWVLPAFQFEGDKALPGLDVVMPRVPSDLHPLGVLNWFTLPDPDLIVDEDEEPVSPREWLIMGRDPKTVAALAEGL